MIYFARMRPLPMGEPLTGLFHDWIVDVDRDIFYHHTGIIIRKTYKLSDFWCD